MKPFNLERTLAGDPVITRAGRTVKIAGHNPDAAPTEQLVGWVDEHPCYWYFSGKYLQDIESKLDLFMTPIKKTGWINLYRCSDNTLLTGGAIYDTEDEAHRIRATAPNTHTIKITWEE